MISILGVLGAPPKRIVGGNDTTPDEFPYQVSLVVGEEHFCGGSIISPTHILTAAHCLYYLQEPDQYQEILVLTGTNNLLDGGNLYYVKSIKIHPEFEDDDSKGFPNDIAVITVSIYKGVVHKLRSYFGGRGGSSCLLR